MLNLDAYSEFVFTEPTWGRLKSRSQRPEDDGIPGEWHVLTEIVAHKESDPVAGGAFAVKSLCERYYYRGMIDGRTERPLNGFWCQRCIIEGVRTGHPGV